MFLRLPSQALSFSTQFFVGNHLFQILLQLAPSTIQKYPFGDVELDHLKWSKQRQLFCVQQACLNRLKDICHSFSIGLILKTNKLLK